MSGIQTIEQRILELHRLRNRIDRELRTLTKEPNQAVRRPRTEVPPCGTETGYQRHRYLGEKCDQCRIAHAEHERTRSVIRRVRQDA